MFAYEYKRFFLVIVGNLNAVVSESLSSRKCRATFAESQIFHMEREKKIKKIEQERVRERELLLKAIWYLSFKDTKATLQQHPPGPFLVLSVLRENNRVPKTEEK